MLVARTLTEKVEDEMTVCQTKGTNGPNCDQCDRINHYFANSALPGCFYDVAPDYQFTFNLSRPRDSNITGINFKSQPNPSKPDVDVDFMIKCADCMTDAKIELFYQNNYEKVELQFVSEGSWQEVEYTFSKDKFSLENGTFFVQVSSFQTPIDFVISFAQHPK